MRAIGTGYECIEKASTATFGGLNIRYAYLSQRGFYPDGALNANAKLQEYCDEYFVIFNYFFPVFYAL